MVDLLIRKLREAVFGVAFPNHWNNEFESGWPHTRSPSPDDAEQIRRAAGRA